MPRPKGAKNKGKKKPNDNIVEEVEIEVEFTCPIRGKVKQKVKVKKIKSIVPQHKNIVVSSDVVTDLDSKDDGLEIYEDIEEE